MHLRKRRGFTLIEGLVVVTILIIFTGMAAAMLLNVKSNEMAAVQSEFLGILNLAHNEAITRALPTIIEAQLPQKVNEFSGGWKLGIDVNNNGNIDPNEPVIRSRSALSKNILFGSVDNQAFKQINKIQFDSRGYLIASSPIKLRICLADSNNQEGYLFIVNNNGLSDVKSNISCK